MEENLNELNYEFSGSGLAGSEKKWAEERFKDYRNRYHIESLSDLQLLEELVFREALQERYKKKVGKLSKEKPDTSGDKPKVKTEVIPTHIIRAMDENLERMMMIKEKLGLFEEKKGEDPFKYIQDLKKKFKIWREENQGSRTVTCPHCSKMILFKIRTEAWEAQKHPYFKDKVLANRHLWKLYKEGKITKEDIGQILGCSTDYIDWLERKIYLRDSVTPSE